MNLEILENKINIQFSYNGNLGTLQEKTKSNLEKIELLVFEKIIDITQYRELYKRIQEYFVEQLQLVLKTPHNFLH